MEIDIKQVKMLMRALRRYDCTEVEIRQGDEEIRVRRGGVVHSAGVEGLGPMAFPMTTGARGVPGQIPSLPSMVPGAAPGSGGAASADDPSIVTVTSPLVGTFYRAAAPGAKNFVEIGSPVQPKSVLCIVEAMKLMNEIEAEIDGTIVEVLVENGKPVEFGEKLFKIKKSG